MQTALIAIVGLISLFIGLILMLVLPGIRFVSWIILALGVIFLAAAFILEFRRVRGALVSRRGKFSTSTTIMVSIFIGIILLVNAISIGNHHRFDFTGLAQFTLTSQTKDVLAELKTPVEVLCFFKPDNIIREHAKNLLTEYQYYTQQLRVEEIDPDLRPDQARQYGVTEAAAQYGTVVFKSKEGQRSVYGPQIVQEAEHAFTSAILEVTGITQKKVYFLIGHGESSIYSDYSNAREGLLDNLYQVEVLDLLLTHKIPDDCAALVIAAPTKPLTSEESDIVARYLKNGGDALILTNPNPPQDIRQLISTWGINMEDGIVVDPASYAAPSIETPSVPRIRNNFGFSTICYFPEATALIPQKDLPETIQIMPLVWTSKDSWLEKKFDPDKEPRFDEGVDVKGPLALGVLLANVPASEAQKDLPDESKITRLVVFGDSDFASNQHFYNGSNGQLFVTSVNVLAAGAEIVSIERKVLQTRRLIIGPEEARFLNISSIGLLPVIILVIGGVIWWRRR